MPCARRAPGANALGIRGDRHPNVKRCTAVLADVVVGWHGSTELNNSDIAIYICYAVCPAPGRLVYQYGAASAYTAGAAGEMASEAMARPPNDDDDDRERRGR